MAIVSEFPTLPHLRVAALWSGSGVYKYTKPTPALYLRNLSHMPNQLLPPPLREPAKSHP